MKIQRNQWLFLCFFFFQNFLFSQNNILNAPLLSMIGAAMVNGSVGSGINVDSLYLAQGQSQSSVSKVVIGNQIQEVVSGPGVMRVTGSVVFNGNDMTIALPTTISELQISGNVEIKIPVGGVFEITVNGSPYHAIIPGLSVYNVNSAFNFDINSLVIVNGQLSQTNAIVSISDSLTVSATAISNYIFIDNSSALSVGGEINFDGVLQGYLSNSGSITALGNIVMSNNKNIQTNGSGLFNHSSALIRSADGAITMNGNIGEDGAVSGIQNFGIISAALDIVMSSNRGNSSGLYNDIAGSIISTGGAISLNDNTGQTQPGMGNFGIIRANGNIVINNNISFAVSSHGAYNHPGASIVSVNGAILMNENIAQASNYSGCRNLGTITAVLDITMNNNSNVNGYGMRNSGTITTSAGSIVMNANIGNGVNCAAVSNSGTMTAGSDITMNNNSNLNGFGVLNSGTIATTNRLTMNTNIGNGVNCAAVYNGLTMTAGSDITMNDNQGVVGFGVLNDTSATMTSSDGAIEMNENLGLAGITNYGTISSRLEVIMNNNLGTTSYGVFNNISCMITSIAGAITMNGNVGQGIAWAGVLNNGIISAINDITLNNNINMNGKGVYNNTTGTITTSAGSIVMNNNQAGQSGSYGVNNLHDLSAFHNITMNNNSGVVGGVSIVAGATVKTGGLFTITIADLGVQKFDSSAVAIKRMDGTTNVSFSSFAVTVGGVSCPTYGAIPANRVLLAAGNQS